jgi:hypothetical protein
MDLNDLLLNKIFISIDFILKEISIIIIRKILIIKLISIFYFNHLND